MMKATLTTAAIVASFALLGGIFAMAGPTLAYPQPYTTTTMTGNATETMTSDIMGMWGNDTSIMFKDMKVGAISSIQNDEEGQPAWIVAGHWTMNLAPQNDTEASNATDYSNITDFHAGLYMIMLDGSAAHTHEISNFTLLEDGVSTEDNSTTISGTTTVTMREGPVHDVDTQITISQDQVIEISLNPEDVQNHFGDTNIYGIVITPEMLHHMMGNMTGMMDNRLYGNNTDTAIFEEMWK